MTEYLTKTEFTQQKRRLSRAKLTENPVAVLDAVERTLDEWSGKAWPDDWHRWNVALHDAYYKFVRSPAGDDDRDLNDEKISRRFRAAFDRLA